MAPAVSARSVASARSGVPAMLIRPTDPPWTATPTIAQSIARRVNFSKAQFGPGRAGTRISVSTSSGSSAVVNGPRKKSPASTVRCPPVPRTTNTASQAISAAGRSAAASPCTTDPPMVPRWRTCRSPITPATCASSGACSASTGSVSSSRYRLSAPIAISSPSRRT